jgi:hypothetical protein
MYLVRNIHTTALASLRAERFQLQLRPTKAWEDRVQTADTKLQLGEVGNIT